MGIWKKHGERAVARAAKTSCIGGHNADEIDNINTLAGVVSALALAFVLGLQYMVAPGTDEMTLADFRSLLCKSQDFRTYVHEVFKIEDIGKHSEEYFNFTRLVRPGQYMDIEQLLLTGFNDRFAEAPGPTEHIACITDKDLQTAAVFLFDEFPAAYLKAFILQTPGIYRWSRVTERIGAIAAAFVFAALLWSIILNLSLALAPVREDSTGKALVAWLMVGGPTMILNYLSLIGGLIAFFFTHGRQLVAGSPYAGSTIANTVDLSLFSILLPLFILGVVLGLVAKLWSEWQAAPIKTPEAEPEPSEEDSTKMEADC